MQRTISRLLAAQFRSRTLHLTSDLISIKKTALTNNEICYRRHLCLCNANLQADQGSAKQRFRIARDPAKDLSKWWIDYKKRKSFKERCVARVATCLQCSESMAEFLIDADPILFLDKIDSTLLTIELLLNNGIPTESIRRNIAILRYSDSELQLRLKCMKQWGIDQQYYGEFLPMFKLPIADFLLISNSFTKERIKKVPDGNRVIHFAKILGCSVRRTNGAFTRCRLLYRLNFDDVKKSLLCYLEFQVKPELILKDISYLKYSPEVIRSKLTKLHQKGLQPLRPSLVGCSEFQYKRMCRVLENKVNPYAPYKNVEEYLEAKIFSSNRSCCTAEKKRRIFRLVETADPKNVIRLTEFFSEKKITVEEICANIYIFNHDVDHLRKRYEIVQKMGVKYLSLQWLMKDQAEFEEYVKRMEFNMTEEYDMSEMTSLIDDSKG